MVKPLNKKKASSASVLVAKKSGFVRWQVVLKANGTLQGDLCRLIIQKNNESFSEKIFQFEAYALIPFLEVNRSLKLEQRLALLYG